MCMVEDGLRHVLKTGFGALFTRIENTENNSSHFDLPDPGCPPTTGASGSIAT
jgi:hypothetical protein